MSWFKKNKIEEIQNTQPEKTASVSNAVKSGTVASDLILRPIVTEKTAHLTAQGQYVFAVNSKANKIQIYNAIRKMYGVIPVSINTQSIKGKKIRFGKTHGQRKDWKKAIVTLKKGNKIEMYEGV